MHPSTTLDATASTAKQAAASWALFVGSAALIGTFLISSPARAADGCKVLMCLAASNWRSIPQCVPPIQEVLNDLARGRPFPICRMSGPANSANHQWASAPAYCPPQYTHVFDSESGPIFSCDYVGAVAVNVEGELWARTWWSFAGDTVTEFTPTAKTRLRTWDIKFDEDYAAWLATQPAPTHPCSSC